MGDEDVSYLEDMLRALTSRGVRFVVAGGVAAVLHGIERTTMDLDIALDLEPENVKHFAEACAAIGLRPLVPVPVEALADPDMPLRKIDVFLTEQLGYESLLEDSIEVQIPGIPLRVVSLERLLALKRAMDPPRDKDLFDIRAIERLLQGGPEDD
jgi:predicted nucleotidyltransferase